MRLLCRFVSRLSETVRNIRDNYKPGNQQQKNKPAPSGQQRAPVEIGAQTFWKLRFRVLFWRHSQTQRIGSLDDQIHTLPVSISSEYSTGGGCASSMDSPPPSSLSQNASGRRRSRDRTAWRTRPRRGARRRREDARGTFRARVVL